MLRAVFACIFATLGAALPAAADGFEPVTDKARFLQLIEGRELRLGLFGVGLRVLPDGRIEGSAMGWPITGSWEWREGYFCREMDWSGTAIAPNCQLVEARGNALRFTVDRGAGQSAEFALR